jgi:nucleotide-binding universal stress UspA family protein
VASDRPVLCAIKDSDESRHAVKAATWLARELGTRLLIAHAFDPLGIPARPRGEMVALDITDEDLELAERSAARRLLDEVAHTVEGVALETELPEGQPLPTLLSLASDHNAALLVTGTVARGEFDRILAGSLPGALAAAAPCPVVVVPPAAALEEPGPVVAGYDGSAHSLRAAHYGAALAAALGRELLLLHITGEEGVRADEALVRDLHAAGTRGLGDDPGRPRLDLNVRLKVEDGEPVETLAVVAAEESAALVVTGTRGRNALSAALLGSVSAGLVRAARRPVALVPASAGDLV